MKSKALLAIRILYGLLFVVFGLNGFLQFIPVPPMPEKAAAFMGGLMQSGYFFPLLKATEIICGALVLAGFFAPLALVIMAPIVLNILCFHIFVTGDGVGVAAAIVIFQIVLMYSHRSKYTHILQAK